MRLIKTVRRGIKSSPLSPLYHKPRQWGTPEGESPTFKIHSHRVRNQTLCRVDGRRSILNHANRRFRPRLLAELPSGESVRLNRAGTVSYKKTTFTTRQSHHVLDEYRGRFAAADRSVGCGQVGGTDETPAPVLPSASTIQPFMTYMTYIYTYITLFIHIYPSIHEYIYTYIRIIHTNHTYESIHTNQYITGLTITLTLT